MNCRYEAKIATRSGRGFANSARQVRPHVRRANSGEGSFQLDRIICVRHQTVKQWAVPHSGKSVPHSSRLYRDEWAASSCCPHRLDFNDSSDPGAVVAEAAPSALLGRCDWSPFYGASVDISDHFGPSSFAMDVRVKMPLAISCGGIVTSQGFPKLRQPYSDSRRSGMSPIPVRSRPRPQAKG